MATVTKEQIDKKWDSLTPALREAIFSDLNDQFVLKLCQEQHVPEPKMNAVFSSTGSVLMGFLDPEDLANEIKEATSLPPQVVKTIAEAINQRIFAPLKQDLDAIYTGPPAISSSSPKILKDVSAIYEAPATPALKPASPQPPAAPVPSINRAVPSAPPPPAPAPVPKPKLPEPGWSRSTPEQPIVKLSQTSSPAMPSSPAGPRVPPPLAKPPTTPTKGTMGEFERKAIQGGQGASPLASPAPVIIHEDAVFQTQQSAPNFRIPSPKEGFDALKGTGGSSSSPLLKPAVLEFGKSSENVGNKPPTPVHYTQYKAAQQAPIAPGNRQITEITPIAPIPSPPKPPGPPTAPKSAAAEKVIVKNYGLPEPPKPPQPPPSPPAPPTIK